MGTLTLIPSSIVAESLKQYNTLKDKIYQLKKGRKQF